MASEYLAELNQTQPQQIPDDAPSLSLNELRFLDAWRACDERLPPSEKAKSVLQSWGQSVSTALVRGAVAKAKVMAERFGSWVLLRSVAFVS